MNRASTGVIKIQYAFMDSKIIFKETQYFLLSIIPSVLIGVLLLVTEIFNLGSKPAPLFVTLLAFLSLLILVILTYKMSITITEKSVIVKFGVGLIRKEITLSSIQADTIKETYITWYYGVGIRFFAEGIIYNTKSGKGIEFETSEKKYRIGTKNAFEIAQILSNTKN